MKKHYDPVKEFERERSQKGTAASKWDSELKLRGRAGRQPLVAMIWSYKYPGAGMFYIRRPVGGIMMIVIYLVGIVVVFSATPASCAKLIPDSWPRFPFWGVIVKLLICGCFGFVFSVFSSIYTFFAAMHDRKCAIAELEKIENEKTASK